MAPTGNDLDDTIDETELALWGFGGVILFLICTWWVPAAPLPCHD